MKQDTSIKDFDYTLPPDRIPEFPMPRRDGSKLLVYRNSSITDDTFYHLPGHLTEQTTLVLNNTRVIEARLLFQKPTGGFIEIFCLEPAGLQARTAMLQTAGARWHCMVGGASKWKAGQVLEKTVLLDHKPVLLEASYEEKLADSFLIRFRWNSNHTFGQILEAAGAVPLPPYIKRKAVDTDADRYQTVFAREKGSVAAPTAALHFTDAVFEKLAEKDIFLSYITLHVGVGTFRPVKTERIQDHSMHAESFACKKDVLEILVRAKTIVAVGTTSLRTLESMHWLGAKLIVDPALTDFTLQQWEDRELAKQGFSFSETITALHNYMELRNLGELWCRTSLLILPGYRFASASALVTNFHQPCSTLLLLIAAFIGDDWRKVYQHALENGYRFLSYGDSSLLWRKEE